MRTSIGLLVSALLFASACAPCEPRQPWGFSCVGVDEYDSEALADECRDLGGLCAAQEGGGGPICVRR